MLLENTVVLHGWWGYQVNSRSWSVQTGVSGEFQADNLGHVKIPPGAFIRSLTPQEVSELAAWDAASDEALHNFENMLD
jgi:hypothetical protein